MLHLVSLGALHLTGEAGVLLAGRRKLLALLAHVAWRAPDPVPRTELIRLLWEDRIEARGKQCLRQSLADLRATIGDAIVADAGTVSLNGDAIALDAVAFLRLVAAEQWADAARAWTGEFLPGTDGVGGEQWRAWLDATRATLRDGAARAFAELTAEQQHAGAWRAVAEWSERWCEVAPYDERPHAIRIDALIRCDRAVEAGAVHAAFVRRMRTERRAEPSADFRALRHRFSARGAPLSRPARDGGDLTLSQITQLPLDARRLAEAAAVVGEPADERVLRSISGLEALSARQAMDRLTARGVLRQSEGAPDRWEFASEATRQRVYSVIARDRRRAFHLATWTHLAAGVTDEAERERLAHHRLQGEVRRVFTVPRRAVMGVAAVALAAVTIPWGISRIGRADAMELAPGSTILLADVRNETGEAIFGRALGTAAALGLQQSRHVALVPQSKARALVSSGRGEGERRIDEATARGIAVRESVARVVSLGVERTDSVYRLAARVIDPRTGQVLGEEQVEVRRNNLVDGLDGLISRVRMRLGESPSDLRESSQPLRAVASPSLEALDAYTEGARAAVAGRRDSARVAWRRALQLDSSFALAELALAHDAFERGDSARGDAWMARAVAHADRLTTLEALRAHQMLALRSGDLARARALATTIAEREPSADAWFAVAQAELTAGSCPNAGPALASAIALDSLHVPARLAMARCAVASGDVETALRHHGVVQRVDSAVWARSEYVADWGTLLVRSGRMIDAEGAFRRLLASPVVADSVRGLRLLAALEMYRGRYGLAIPLLQQATLLTRRGATAAVELHRSLLLEIDASLATGGRTRASELVDEAFGRMSADSAPPDALFHLGYRMVRLGRINGAREVLRRLAAGVVDDNPIDRWAARLLAAAVHVAERLPAEALVVIGDSTAPPSLEPFRLTIAADAHALAEQHDAAAQVATRLAGEWHLEGLVQDEWMRTTLRLGRIAEARGDTAAALAAYERVLTRWKDADLYLVDLAAAQRGLTRLGGAVATRR